MIDPYGPQQFATTHWSLVGAANLNEASHTRARDAQEELCRTYWYPLYAFVRSRGYSANDAQDLTQAFFASIIESGGFGSANRQYGRFRSYLLGAMKHFLSNEWNKAKTQKRGGNIQFVEWDAVDVEGRYSDTACQTDDPELLFDYEWAMEIISNTLKTLRQEMEDVGKGEQFEALKGCLTGEEDLTREKIAEKLNMTDGAIKTAVHRLRQRYRNLLRAAIAETVSNEDDLNDEMQYLIKILRKT